MTGARKERRRRRRREGGTDHDGEADETDVGTACAAAAEEGMAGGQSAGWGGGSSPGAGRREGPLFRPLKAAAAAAVAGWLLAPISASPASGNGVVAWPRRALEGEARKEEERVRTARWTFLREEGGSKEGVGGEGGRGGWEGRRGGRGSGDAALLFSSPLVSRARARRSLAAQLAGCPPPRGPRKREDQATQQGGRTGRGRRWTGRPAQRGSCRRRGTLLFATPCRAASRAPAALSASTRKKRKGEGRTPHAAARRRRYRRVRPDRAGRPEREPLAAGLG